MRIKGISIVPKIGIAVNDNIFILFKQFNISSVTFNSAKAIVSMIPVVAIYPFIQKFFVTGIVMGAVKE